jgi:hypothetical protein
MLHKNKPSKPDDELTARLRTAARKRQPWTLARTMVVLAFILIPAGLFGWWVYPRAAEPPVELVAFDQLGVPGSDITIHARLEPLLQPEEPLSLRRYEITFDEELPPAQAARERQLVKVFSAANGEASTGWMIPADRQVSAYVARQLGDRLHAGKNDRGQVFSCPAATPLLLVDVQHTLADAPEDAWRTRNVLDIAAVDGAGNALQEAHKRKYQIVYLATDPDRALLYRKVRGWIMNQQSARKPFPPGPVLGRPSFDQEPSQARHAVLRGLKERFTGPIVAVVGSSEAAAAIAAVGLEMIVIGDAGAPVGVTRVKSWPEAASALKQRH